MTPDIFKLIPSLVVYQTQKLLLPSIKSLYQRSRSSPSHTFITLYYHLYEGIIRIARAEAT